MVSDKESIERLVKIFEKKGVRYIVFSPGSRNAPLIISFDNNRFFHCLNIPDERVAGFFALGMAQQLGQAVALCCTSGSALLNYAPAIVEAYYQKIPLLILSADRPVEWIDQRAGQTMRQRNVYNNYIKNSFELLEEPAYPDQLFYNDRIVNKAIDECISGPKGPVHINLPLKEPLYQVKKVAECEPKITATLESASHLTMASKELILEKWQSLDKIIILAGQGDLDPQLSDVLNELALIPGIVVLTETTSNVKSHNVYSCIDRMIDSISEEELAEYTPSLLITIGKSIVSKKVRWLFGTMKIPNHWHIDEDDRFIDTFNALTLNIPLNPMIFIKELLEHTFPKSDDFERSWKNKNKTTTALHNEFLSVCEWSDMRVFKMVLDALPTESRLHLSNSTPVRYAQLFDQRMDIQYYSNRGVSGIDGCASTAAGCAYIVDEIVTLITGDIAFFYDSNSFWHHHLSQNLRVVLINNEGGSIFRFIPGPSSTNQLERHFEARHKTTAKGIAETHKLNYFHVEKEDELRAILPAFFSNEMQEAAILEIKTPRTTNDQVLKSYFEFLKTE